MGRKVPGYKFEFETTICINECDREVVVEAEVSDFWPAQTYGPPERCYPDEGGEVELLSVKDAQTGEEITLPSDVEEALIDQATERAPNHEPDGPDPDAWYDSRIDREYEPRED